MYNIYSCDHVPNFEQVWDAFIQEEIRREIITTINNEILNETLINKVKKGGKKG